MNADVWQLEHFVLDEVLQLVAERALTLTGADGVAVAMAEGDAIVCRAAAGTIVPEPGARLDPKSGFSGACLRSGGIVRCDDTEHDPRVNVQVCRRLGTRSIVAVPIASAHGTLGLLEAFSAEPYGFNDSDVRSLKLLAELILAAMKPEEENRLAEISQRLVAEPAVETPAGRVQGEDAAATAGASSTSAPAEAEELQITPETFQEFGKKQKFTFSIASWAFGACPGPGGSGGSVVEVRATRPLRKRRRPHRLLQLFRNAVRACSRRRLCRKTNRLQAPTTSILRRPW